MKPQTLTQFRDKFTAHTHESAAEILGFWPEDFNGRAVYIHAETHCWYELTNEAETYWCMIGQSEYMSTESAIVSRLYFDHYCSECNLDWDWDFLTILLRDFAEWSRIDWASADDMIHTAETQGDKEWLLWFMREWEERSPFQ